MTDRLTDAELDELEQWGRWGRDWGYDDVLALVAEVREHRAARADPPAEVVRERWALVESETLMLPKEADRD